MTEPDLPSLADPADIASQISKVKASGLLSHTLDRLQGLIVVVNAERRIVYANKSFLDFFGRKSQDELCGARPGEVLRCIHAEKAGGCGISEACEFCGVLQSILETQASGAPSTKECRITSSEDGTTSHFEFLVRTFPFDLDGIPFILVSFRDISEQKKRIALERVFFHDILNTVSSVKVYIDLLKATAKDDAVKKLVLRLEGISKTLMDEIMTQKIMVSAENRTLRPQRNLMESAALIRQVIQQMEEHETARKKRLVMAPFSETVVFTSDDSLLRRILVNMIKNALEASPEEATVTVGCRQVDRTTVGFWVHNPTVIPEKIRSQIFQRYFSTKGEDRGLGTYSMKLLTEEYLKGRITFETSREKGTTFTVTLPTAPGGRQQAPLDTPPRI